MRSHPALDLAIIVAPIGLVEAVGRVGAVETALGIHSLYGGARQRLVDIRTREVHMQVGIGVLVGPEIFSAASSCAPTRASTPEQQGSR
jgi:hypothetical protein